jgi:hypothetical protein
LATTCCWTASSTGLAPDGKKEKKEVEERDGEVVDVTVSVATMNRKTVTAPEIAHLLSTSDATAPLGSRDDRLAPARGDLAGGE